jgi:ribosomal protein S18 acetylase RimI-like enzyme
MNVQIHEEPNRDLSEYATIPTAFEVREMLAVVMPEAGLHGVQLVARQVEVPYVKDYDTEPAHHPSRWQHRFDVSHWGILGAWVSGARVGGAVIAWRSSAVEVLDGREDLAVLWDLRVTPAARGQGVGAALFREAEQWAVARGASWLRAETQNVNVPACRFYASQGCTLGALHRFAYDSLPDEVQLLWYKQLVPNTG